MGHCSISWQLRNFKSSLRVNLGYSFVCTQRPNKSGFLQRSNFGPITWELVQKQVTVLSARYNFNKLNSWFRYTGILTALKIPRIPTFFSVSLKSLIFHPFWAVFPKYP